MPKTYASFPAGGVTQRGLLNTKRKQKADRERYRRARLAVFKKSHDYFVDGPGEGRKRRVFVCIYDQGLTSQGKYFTYNSHPDEAWLPSEDFTVSFRKSKH